MQKIMFNDKFGLTDAVLEGRKTMTRRLAEKVLVEDENCYLYWNGEFKNPRYKPGDVVAVAQNYNEVFDEFVDEVYDNGKGNVPENWRKFGLQSYKTLPKSNPGWNNKMFVRADFMPHQIRITNVRVERLQDISDEDCLREGIYKQDPRPGITALYAFETCKDQYGSTLAKRWFSSPREAFAALIDKVSGKGTWARNPYVYVYKFELVK